MLSGAPRPWEITAHDSSPGNPWRAQKVNSESRLTLGIARTCLSQAPFPTIHELDLPYTLSPEVEETESPYARNTLYIHICMPEHRDSVNGVSARFYQQRAARRVDTLFRTSGMGGGHRPGHLQLGV